MGILDGLSGKKKALPASATFRITELGRDKLQDFSGNPKDQILMALETKGTSNLKEISAATRLSRGQVERLMPKLYNDGYVQFVNSSSGGLDD